MNELVDMIYCFLWLFALAAATGAILIGYDVAVMIRDVVRKWWRRRKKNAVA